MTSAHHQGRSHRGLLAVLVIAGLALRVSGLYFYGVYDLDEMLLDWGAAVQANGLISAFGINYGLFSYACFGLAYELGESIPRFWWLPYKLMVLVLDVGVLGVLLRMVPAGHAVRVVLLFWLNPFFIVHESFQGFWEAAHILPGLLAVAWMGRRPAEGPVASTWCVVGVLLAVSAMFKPQGFLYFVAPVGLALVVLAWRRRAPQALVGLVAGLVGVVAGLSAIVWLAGGSGTAILENYGTVFSVMPSISNGGPGIWRFVAFVIMAVTDQLGHVSTIRIPGLTLAVLSEAAAVAVVSLIGVFSWRMASRTSDRPLSLTTFQLLCLLALSSLAMAQFGVRAHINHSYTALVLLVPLAAIDPACRRLWTGLVVLLGFSGFLFYGLGQPTLLPSQVATGPYSNATPLVAAVQSLPVFEAPDGLIRLQQAALSVGTMLPSETIVSLLSLPVFVLAVLLTRRLFQLTESRSFG